MSEWDRKECEAYLSPPNYKCHMPCCLTRTLKIVSGGGKLVLGTGTGGGDKNMEM